jgi:transcription-repair coupling factor (superfamily II helicase)
MMPNLRKMASPDTLSSMASSQQSITEFSWNLAKQVLADPVRRIVLVPDSLSASVLEKELRFFLGEAKEFLLWPFPDWETLPYDRFSPHQDIVSDRLKTLYRLMHDESGILIVPISTIMHRLCPRDYLLTHGLMLKQGQRLDLLALRQGLQEAGYRVVEQVNQHGDLAVRGSLLDLYPMGSEWPVRVDFFGDEIDTLRWFYPDTQRSVGKLEQVQILPASECALTDEGITHFRNAWRSAFEGSPTQASVYQRVSEGDSPPGIEYFLPLFFTETTTLLDYLKPDTQIIRFGEIEKAAQAFWTEACERYEQYGSDITYPLLPPKILFFSVPEVFQQIKTFSNNVQIRLKTELNALPDVRINARDEAPLSALSTFLKSTEVPVLFCCETAGRRAVLQALINKAGWYPHVFDDWQAVIETSPPAPQCMVLAPFSAGIYLPEIPLWILTEAELFGRRIVQQRGRQKQRMVDQEAVIRDLVELNIGAPVVHLTYGIGRYLGLSQMTVADQSGEYLSLEYQGGDKLYVPVSSLDLISRYSGLGTEPVLSRLGTAQWKKARQEALEKAKDVAAELLQVYATRAAHKGEAFARSESDYQLFIDEFPFEETPDQATAINAVLEDLFSASPMDRVICGDVGFGKTEVALRAAFVSVAAGKQVAVLAPTTLLVEQHAQTFADRFAAFPVKIESLSRFRTQKDQKQVLEKLKSGQVDIVIGTHKLLQKEVAFKHLGLVIIDEEHRFGVQQKESFKKLRASVNLLTLTATPIPRTLNMAMGGVRDLSIIATPPLRRLSIKTFVQEYQVPLIQEAILRELHRGGQVYYLHNTIETILRRAEEIQAWVPSARVCVAHGQMHERELERVMSDFYQQRFNVLVCTTIIETGIDIPSANTILIERADKLGLAQLHQLRGRVGRSHHQAYAYCLTPPKTVVKGDAEKRLFALQSAENLGAGFTLATHDLEIRGAGELLGEEQSGKIQAVGFSLYQELLAKAVNAIKHGKILTLEEIVDRVDEVNLHIPAFIPDKFIPDVHTRLVLYKRVASAETKKVSESLAEEIRDRFGTLPDPVVALFTIAGLRRQAVAMGISRLEAHAKGGWLEFASYTTVDPSAIITLIQKESKTYQFAGPHKLKFVAELADKAERMAFVKKLMQRLVGCP